MGCWSQFTTAQEPKIIQIRQAGSFEKDESLYPEANILSKKGETRVHLFHKGALVVSDKVVNYDSLVTFLSLEPFCLLTIVCSMRNSSSGNLMQ